jgi:hypothetical protein
MSGSKNVISGEDRFMARAPKEEQTGTIRIVDDQGKEDVAVEYTKMIDATTLSDSSERWIPGTKRYMLQSSRNHLNKNGETFEEVATGRTFKRAP